MRFNLLDVENVTRCMDHVRIEKLDENGVPVYSGVPLKDACIVVLHLETVHPDARGFRRGILGNLHPMINLANNQYHLRI